MIGECSFSRHHVIAQSLKSSRARLSSLISHLSSARENFRAARKKPLTRKFSTFTFVSQKGGTKRHGQEEESHDQEVFQEDDEEEEITSLLTPPAWLLTAATWFGSNSYSYFSFGPGSNLGLETKKKASQPRRKLSFFMRFLWWGYRARCPGEIRRGAVILPVLSGRRSSLARLGG